MHHPVEEVESLLDGHVHDLTTKMAKKAETRTGKELETEIVIEIVTVIVSEETEIENMVEIEIGIEIDLQDATERRKVEIVEEMNRKTQS